MTPTQLFRIRLSLGRRLRSLVDPLGPTVAYLQDRPLTIRFTRRSR